MINVYFLNMILFNSYEVCVSGNCHISHIMDMLLLLLFDVSDVFLLVNLS